MVSVIIVNAASPLMIGWPAGLAQRSRPGCVAGIVVDRKGS
jgi:hypothetical protein